METLEQKTERNCRVQARYDELMREGKRGHYETMFRVVREEVLRDREQLCAAIKAADDKASEGDYMLDSDDCISVIRGTWHPGA